MLPSLMNVLSSVNLFKVLIYFLHLLIYFKITRASPGEWAAGAIGNFPSKKIVCHPIISE